MSGMTQFVVHTGQHYDDALSASFFRDLGIAAPDVNLEVGSSSHAVQVARIMERIEPVLIEQQPDWVLVYGDVNSTAAAEGRLASRLNRPAPQPDVASSPADTRRGCCLLRAER